MFVHYLIYITQYIITPNSKLTGYPVQWITNISNECLDQCRYIITIPQAQDGDFVGCFSKEISRGEARMYNNNMAIVTCESRSKYPSEFTDIDLHLRLWKPSLKREFKLYFNSTKNALPWNYNTSMTNNFGTIDTPIDMTIVTDCEFCVLFNNRLCDICLEYSSILRKFIWT